MINAPRFLTTDEVRLIHLDQVTRYGGATDVRDEGLLESAVMSPRAMFSGTYLHADIVEMAAAYLFHIVSNHPFIDGNKRVGTVAALIFLELNGLAWLGDDDDLFSCVMHVAEGKLEKNGVADFLRQRVKPLP